MKSINISTQEMARLPRDQQRQLLRWVWASDVGKNVPIFVDGEIIRYVNLPKEFVDFVKKKRAEREAA